MKKTSLAVAALLTTLAATTIVPVAYAADNAGQQTSTCKGSCAASCAGSCKGKCKGQCSGGNTNAAGGMGCCGGSGATGGN